MVTKRSKDYDEFIKTYQPRVIEFIPIPLYKSAPEKEEKVSSNPLEPQSFKDFVGQEQAKEILGIIVDSANKEQRLIPNILLTGAFGHGKTTLAKLVAKRHKKKVKIIDGSVAGTAIRPDPNKIYIVDEAHNIPSSITDTFNIMIDAGQLRMIGCTTNPGALPAAFRSRFRTIYLTEYQPIDIAKIVEKAAKRLEISISQDAINTIANRAKCNPRSALTILDFVREIGSLSGEAEVSLDVVNDALGKLGIDDVGLTTLDRRYLEILRPDKPVGLQYISSILSLDGDTVQEEIEPYLLRMGLMERTARGRIRVSPDNSSPNVQEILNNMWESLSQ